MTLPMQKAYYDARASGSPIVFGQTVKDGETRIQIAVEFVIEDQDFAGETITWVGHFTDKTAARTIESLQIAGWQGEDVSELDRQTGSTVLPEIVSLVCEPDEYNGDTKLKVQWVNRPGGGRFKFKEQISGTDLKAFGAQMRATVKSVRAQGGAPRKAWTGGSRDGQKNEAFGGYGGHPNAPGNNGGNGGPPPDDIPF